MEKFGIGVDIEEVARFRKLDRIRNKQFLEKIFTPAELTYCFDKKDPAPHLAVRFCGKEAVIKALAGIGEKAYYRDIAIVHKRNGVPSVKIIHGSFSAQISLSLSHTRDTAIASAFVMRCN